jgi:2-methylcitrate dehydratase PrpD
VHDELTGRLAEFASGLRYEDIPERVRAFGKTLLLDAAACAFAGYQGEDTPKVERFARALGASPDCTVIGNGRLSAAGATVLNGFLFTAVSMCDVYRPTATHLQPVVIPPALAIAEQDDASGRDLLVALVCGFEIAVRIAAGVDYDAFRKRGWHGPGTIGPFGAAAAVGRLRRFDADRMARAFALAGSQAAGTFAAWGTPMVKFHQCRGALSGLMAALLAAEDFAAPRTFLTAADGGFYAVYAGGDARADAVRDLGQHWEMEQIALRPWPTSAASQAVITALLQLVRREALKAERVAQLRIALSRASFDAYASRREFSGKWEASSSIHYTAAVALHDGYVWLDQFEPQRYGDPALLRFIDERLELVCDPSLTGVQAIVEMQTDDGRSFRLRCDSPKGSPENPLSAAETQQKLRNAARGQLTVAELDAVVETVSRLETLASVRTLLSRLRREDH